MSRGVRPRTTPLALALWFGVALAPLACSRGEQSAPNGAVNQSSDASTSEQLFVDGDEQIRWRSTAEPTGVRTVRETFTFGTDGEGVRTLVFAADGQLQSATERRTQTIYPANASPTLMEVQLELRFAGDRVITATKRIDNGPGDVRPYEIDRIRRHATAMRTLIP